MPRQVGFGHVSCPIIKRPQSEDVDAESSVASASAFDRTPIAIVGAIIEQPHQSLALACSCSETSG